MQSCGPPGIEFETNLNLIPRIARGIPVLYEVLLPHPQDL